MTMDCRPRHRPKAGSLVSRANFQSADLAVDAADAEARRDHDAVDVVESGGPHLRGFATIGRNHLTLTLAQLAKPPALMASVTDR